jgi:hypothetical protein
MYGITKGVRNESARVSAGLLGSSIDNGIQSNASRRRKASWWFWIVDVELYKQHNKTAATAPF